MNRDWKQMKLIDIIQKTETINPQKTPNASFEYIDISSICNKRFVIQETSTIFGKDAPSRARKLVRTGDVLFATVRPTLKRIAQVPKHLDCQVCSTGYFVFRPKDFVEAKFLFYFLFTEHFMGAMEHLQKGASYPAVNDGEVSSQNILIPSLSEQKRIVAIVDQAFEGIDRAIANTKNNLTNARELFESYLNAIFIQKGDGWMEKKVDEIGGEVFTGPFGSLLHKADYISNGIPIVNPANIEDDEIIPNLNKTVSQDVIVRLQAYVLSQNNIVIGRRGEIGRCAVVRKEQAGWLCGSGSFFIKTFENVNSVFLTHLFRSAQYRSRLEALSAGATMQNLSNQALSGLLIAMPPLDEQNEITDRLDALKVEAQRLEAIYQQKLAALNELKQSILQKAFTGELTADIANQTTKKAEEAIAA